MGSRAPTSRAILSGHDRARVAYMPVDVDRRAMNEHLPDHAAFLANVVRWTAAGRIPLVVAGPSVAATCEQADRMILHLVNPTSEATWRAPLTSDRVALHRRRRLPRRARYGPRGCWCRCDETRHHGRGDGRGDGRCHPRSRSDRHWSHEVIVIECRGLVQLLDVVFCGALDPVLDLCFHDIGPAAGGNDAAQVKAAGGQ